MMRLATSQTDAHHIMVGSRRIGPGCPAYVIAEAGVNHDGSVDKALLLIDAARDAGADAVKFQMFRADELASATAHTAEYQKSSGGGSQRDMLTRLELKQEDFRRICGHCHQCGIEFLATPFGVHDVDRLIELRVNAFKIASTDLNNLPLLRHVVDTGLPLIVSTGAATADEIHACAERLVSMNAGDRSILLHCVSAYPTPLEAANLRAVSTLRFTFGLHSGFSDHTTDTRTGSWAAALGARVIEKHITLDRSTPGPDHAMSLLPSELAEYIKNVRDVERALGGGALGMDPIEIDVRNVARKSLVAARDLRAGETLTPEMVCIKRPGNGIPPDRQEEAIGRRVAVDVPQDTTLTWEMLQ